MITYVYIDPLPLGPSSHLTIPMEKAIIFFIDNWEPMRQASNTKLQLP